MGKKMLVACNMIAGIGNLEHGTKWLGVVLLICGPLQFLGAWANWKRDI